MKKILFMLLVLASTADAQQGVRYATQVQDTFGRKISFPVVRFCSEPASGIVCTPLAAGLFSDRALGQPVTNPFTGDINGNVAFYVAPGRYHAQVSGNGIVSFDMPDIVLSDPSLPYAGVVSVVPSTAPANQFSTGISGAGAILYAQPAFSNLSGSIALAQTPLTTRGDLLIVGVGPVLSRLALGGNNLYPKSNGSDLVFSTLAAAGVGTPAACTNQVVTGFTLNADAAPVSTCTTITSSFTSGTFPATTHNLLSATHGDTTAAAAVRGDGLFAIGVSPTWQRLAHSAATGGYFKWNGTDMVASTGPAAGTGACTNQFVRGENADAVPTCSTVSPTDMSGTTGTGTTFVLGTSPSIATPTITGVMQSYNAFTLVGNGIPVIAAAVDLGGQTANIGSTILLSLGPGGAGLYRVTVYIVVTTPGTTSTLPAVNIIFTDRDNNTSQTVPFTVSTSTNTLNTIALNSLPVSVKASTSISYSTTGYASTGTAMQYALHIKLEPML